MKIKNNTYVHFSVSCELTEDEARALDALAGYGLKSFLKVFYTEMGKHYLEPHEDGLRSLFTKVRNDIGPALRATEWSRETLKQEIEQTGGPG